MFALLEHDTTPPGVAAGSQTVHWDLLVEAPGRARVPTWRLAHNPLDHAGPVPAARIQDHRPLYLDFEGAISGGRGRVRRLERGPAEVERLAGAELLVHLAGPRLCGRYEIACGADGVLRF
ncbi:MAG: hypothetical protein AB1716_14405, partial [Planctomycetota bacterium]